MSAFDEFYEKYEKPSVAAVTVGFSGIDPSTKSAGGGTRDHEQLDNLLGGDARGHYHLTKYEKDKLTGYPPYEELPDFLKHNELKGLQGGSSGQYYHLNKAEYDKLGEYPPFGELKHEELPDLQGGKNGEHYHLTADDARKLQAIINELIPEGEEVILPSGGITNHELLNSLMGGSAAGHYHFTGDEWRKLRKLLEILFPDGVEDPVFPYSPTDPTDPEQGDTDWTGLPKGTPPAWKINNLPSFSYASTKSQGTCYDGVHKMYYGTLPIRKDGSMVKGLLVTMLHPKTTDKKYFLYTSDLNTWEHFKLHGVSGIAVTYTPIAKYGENVGQFLFREYAYSTSKTYYYLYILGYYGTLDEVHYAYLTSTQATSNNSFGNIQNSDYSGATSWLAGCYSPSLDIYLFASQDGHICRAQGTKANSALKENINCGITVNPGCAAWCPEQQVFCVSGPNGTSTSSNGAAGTWVAHTDAPHNLKDLTYREDLGVLLAWREEDRQFYVSADGTNWTAKHKLPSVEQISTIAAVDYNPDLKWYCAIGGTSKYAYFSKDLEHWVATTVSNGAAIPMGSVIWMPSTNKYVLMPTEGTYFYTFSPADWSD